MAWTISAFFAYIKLVDQSVQSVKQRVEKEVLSTIIGGLGSGEIDSKAAQDIAKDTLVALKMLDEHEETVEKFYKLLSEKHKMFEFLYTKIRAEIVKSREISAHREALVAVDNGDIEGARKIAAGAISTTVHETTNDN